jgi:hypothetical protein
MGGALRPGAKKNCNTPKHLDFPARASSPAHLYGESRLFIAGMGERQPISTQNCRVIPAM